MIDAAIQAGRVTRLPAPEAMEPAERIAPRFGKARFVPQHNPGGGSWPIATWYTGRASGAASG